MNTLNCIRRLGVALAAAAAVLERAHKNPSWRDYATRNMYEDTYMGSAEFSQYLAKRLPEFGEFMTAIGIKKP